MDTALGISLALLLAIFFTWMVSREISRTSEWVSPTTIIAVFAVLDVYLSAARFLAVGGLHLPPWMLPLSDADLVTGMIWFTVGTGCLLAGIGLVGRQPATNSQLSRLGNIEVNPKRSYMLIALSLFLYLGSLQSRIAAAGSYSDFVSARALSRYSPADLNSHANGIGNAFSSYLNSGSLTMLMMLVGVLFFFRVRYNHRLMWGLVLPFVAWLCTLTTFFRGYQLAFFLALLAIETMRVRASRAASIALSARVSAPHRAMSKKRVGIILAVPALLFIGYGSLRTVLHANSSTGPAVSPSSAVSQQIGDLTSGTALIGASEIAKFFQGTPGPRQYLGGKTIFESILLPVPRQIWPTKPKTTGFLKVGEVLSWAPSTQSAVSWPGEFYANFGPIGMVYLTILGSMIGLVDSRRMRPTVFFPYLFALIPAIMVSHWMSILGMMNLLLVSPLLWLATWFVIREGRLSSLNSDTLATDALRDSRVPRENSRLVRKYGTLDRT